MAKVVSTVPKLLTNTIGNLIVDKPETVVAETASAVTPAATTPATTQTDTVDDTSLSDNLNAIETRNRGRLGTIATSFRGVLTDSKNDAALSRRTLLGE
jgi:hypothetical protein